MRQISSNGYTDNRFPIGEAVWIAAGIIVGLAFGDALVLLALVVAIPAMATAWWTFHSAAGQMAGPAPLKTRKL